jgi:hypothetical protein
LRTSKPPSEPLTQGSEGEAEDIIAYLPLVAVKIPDYYFII